MKAWRAFAYGKDGNPADTISNMKLETVPTPKPVAGQVLVKVQFAAINPIDWKLMSGAMDGMCPLTFPYTPCFDIAGTVVQLGEGCKTLAVGDEIIADIGLLESCKKDMPNGPAGALAEFACVAEELVSKRQGLPAKDLVGLPLAGLTSYQALFTGNGKSAKGEPLGNVTKDSKVLILGGASATGALAIQIAKAAGAYVATTASPNTMPDGVSKIDFVKKMGADEVINYKEAEWSDVLAGKDFDLIYDCVGEADSVQKAGKIVKKGSPFLSIANHGGQSTDDVVFKNFLIKSNATDLDKLVSMVVEKKLTVPIDSVLPFDKAAEGLQKSMGWTSAGKLIVQVA